MFFIVRGVETRCSAQICPKGITHSSNYISREVTVRVYRKFILLAEWNTTAIFKQKKL